MILFLDTAKLEIMTIGLIDSDKFLNKHELKAKYKQAELLLPEISLILQKSGIDLDQLKAICVVTGPGPFTALRIGIATANALGYALTKPVIGVVAGLSDKDLINSLKKQFKTVNSNHLIEPVYGQEPNITLKKSHD